MPSVKNNTGRAQSIVTPGEYWLVKQDGNEPWPVVICDEEMVRQYFGDNTRSVSAQRGDLKIGYEISGVLSQWRQLPAICLGTTKP